MVDQIGVVLIQKHILYTVYYSQIKMACTVSYTRVFTLVDGPLQKGKKPKGNGENG